MAKLNHYQISNLLGAKIAPGFRGRFGIFGAISTAKKFEKAMQKECAPSDDPPSADNVLIAKAFEETRQGYSVDVVLATEISESFYARCLKLGVRGSRDGINRRLMRFRKSPPPGIRLSRTTAELPTNNTPFIFAAEIAAAQMRYRFGVTIDDLLIERSVANEFFQLANRIFPGGKLYDYFAAALYVRKNRKPKKEDFAHIERASLNLVESRLQRIGTFDELEENQVPSEQGLFTITETRCKFETELYVGSAGNLRAEVAPFRDLAPFFALNNHFWSPDKKETTLSVAVLSELSCSDLLGWQEKMIEARRPLFNYLKHKAVAA